MNELKDIVSFLQKYDTINTHSSNDNYDKVINELYLQLKNLPDAFYKLKGAYSLPAYEESESDLFYIKDMVMLRLLLKEKKYKAFIHELYDFLRFKIMRDDIDSEIKLPANIKHALMELVETTFEELEDV